MSRLRQSRVDAGEGNVFPDRSWTAGRPLAGVTEGLHQTVARVARHRPDAVAVAHGETRVSYHELDQIADAWAARLAAAGVGPGACVPVALRRGVDLVAALLAVLKTGAAYALLDTSWPVERLRAVVAQLESPLAVAGPGGLDGVDCPVWTPPRGPLSVPAGFRLVPVDGSHPCCVFFTSGTTGQPRGVLTPHRATARLFRPETFARFDASTVIPLAAPTPWDAFSLELWSALLNGGTSVVVDEPYLSAGSLRDVIAATDVNTVWLTSSLFNMVVDEDIDAFRGVTQVLVGGERLSPPHVRNFLRHHPGAALFNGYGPVESTVFATTHRIVLADCDRLEGIPLGRPVPGTRVFVLDGDRQCEVDEVGELCIAGDGLADCYLGDAELTEAKFPHLEIDGSPLRVYRTGDLGYWSSDGLLCFAGRADRQLKVRGHRVEPTEVEQQIENLLPQVRSCRVLAHRDAAGTRDGLFAFCVPHRAGDRLPDALAVLHTGLVAYQRPSAIVSIDAFPVTTNGKLDERALRGMLPAPVVADASAGADGPSLHDPVERAILDSFAAVLGRTAVPSDASFFELGGTSLDAGRVCTRLATRLGASAAVSWLYQCPTAAGFAQRLRTVVDALPGRAVPSGAQEVPLTSMQFVYLIRHLVDPADLTAHCLLIWVMEGELDRAVLAAAVEAVHLRHEALRSEYVPDPEPTARVVDAGPPSLEVLLRQPTVDAAISALRLELARGLEPMEAEVWRTALVPVTQTGVSVFGCVVHHIAFDGRSESILARDLSAAYNAEARRVGDAATVPWSLATGYQGYADRIAGVDPDLHRAYVAELEGVPELRWPARATHLDAEAAVGHLEEMIPPESLQALDASASASGVTRFVALLSRWAAALAEVTHQDDFAIGMPIAQRFDEQTDAMIGCFITMVCVRMRGAAVAGGAAGMVETNKIVQRAFAAQDVPLAEVLETAGRAGRARPPVFQTLFALQDSAPAELDLVDVTSKFVRQPYLDLPLELHAELWPDDVGGLRLVVSYRADAVDVATVRACVDRFVGSLTGRRRTS